MTSLQQAVLSLNKNKAVCKHLYKKKMLLMLVYRHLCILSLLPSFILVLATLR